MTEPSSDDMAKMAQAIGGLAQLNVVAEAVAGYRKKLIDGGVGEAAADEMAVAYNATLMGILTAQFANAQKGASVAASAFKRPR